MLLAAVLTLLTVTRADNECVTLVRQCISGESVLNTTLNGTNYDPLVKPTTDDGMLSQLIRYNQSTVSTVRGKINVDEQFIDQLALLHNNTKQLRVLLSLLQSDSAPLWMRAMSGYGSCGQESAIYTCYEDVCRGYDLSNLTYVNTIFTENVLGFEYLPSSRFSVLLVIRNEGSKLNRPIRIPVNMRTGLSLFYAVYNAVKGFFAENQLQSPLIDRLDKYYHDLDEAYKLPKTNVPRVRYGAETVDAQKHSRQPAVVVKS
ncbi:envelope glycoprotein L [Aotine betaherpesvirus 1]|uniref:Envelope glycoprotein L n=1 Tax=Aotine betaherpesvirus 1 TaxID=50290 RepID=G8XUH3_9BETA|nr:envelope glycoprotein L [Aotine betaherpesvirus 1]AEV80803.1 envelope glycoprotein L [Aotine betaherpesvirus 1]